MEHGELALARSRGLEALEMFDEVGDLTGLSLQLDDLGDLAMREGDPARALLFGGAAAGTRALVAGGAPPTLTRHGDYISDARAALGPERADAAFAAGLAMDHASAVAHGPRGLCTHSSGADLDE